MCGTLNRGFPIVIPSSKEFVVAADEVTVPKLTKNYQNKTIKCLAVQDFLEYHTSTIEEHEIKIDVWFAPEFQSPIIDKYAIVGRSASLICEITASNPPAILFRFFANSNQLNNNDKFEIISNISKQIAILRINKVDEENFGEFKCEVSNIKAKSYQIINLKESSAPGEVHTSLYEVGNRSLTWKIDDDEVDLPTTAYIIEYINKAYIDEITGPNENIEQERLWNSLSMHIKFNKLKDGSYIVDGLQQDTKYMFRIRAENEAGQGDAITIIASTAKHDNKVQSIMANLSLSTNFNFFLSFSIILATILMIN
ncbi:unnamed protein product [Dracunculus medinensis]|uniref:Fibronectin type-III domain-containing protein n=1 Tax=Dracunculus medinensis TaxID=318479 RepID=A0A158Q318_DRAME|nr:unnamed protein product [Dracunculus medinensis]